MNIIRSLISVLILTLIVISVLGFVWWQDPPEKLAGYSLGGQAILAVLVLSGSVGLWRLWSPAGRSTRLR